MQHAGGEFPGHDLIAVGFLQCGNQQPGLYRAVIDEEGLHTPAGAGIRGKTDVAGEGIALPAAFHPDHFRAVPPVNAIHGCLQPAGAGGGQNLPAVPDKLEGHFRVCQRL